MTLESFRAATPFITLLLMVGVWVIILELANAGIVPLALKPGMPIAQLVFQTLTGKAQYEGEYTCQTKPIQ